MESILSTKEFTITLTDSPDPADVEMVKQGLEAHDSSQGAVVDWVPLALFACNAEGDIVAGLARSTYWEYRYEDRLWTDQRFRNTPSRLCCSKKGTSGISTPSTGTCRWMDQEKSFWRRLS